jgi:plastocyanin domain-containing protein
MVGDRLEVASGMEPANVSLRAGVAATITFLRKTDKTCAAEVAFASGMNMLKGTVVMDKTAGNAGPIGVRRLLRSRAGRLYSVVSAPDAIAS